MLTVRKAVATFLGWWFLAFVVTVLAVVLTLPALGVGWQTDDYMHQLAMRRPAELRDLVPPPLLMFSFVPADREVAHRLVDMGWLPWWTYDGLRLCASTCET
jgi:hypothetical protein